MNSRGLLKYLQRDFFIENLRSRSKNEVLSELIEPLVSRKCVTNREILLETLKKRETLGSTGIGKNVAVPHCRTLTVSEIHIVVGLSKNGIDYDSIDKKKVHLFFLIVAPPQEETSLYLPILGKIVEIVRDTKLRRQLLKVHDFETFLSIFES